MPKRSNKFQEVVYLIQTHLAPESRVEESEELTDRITGTPREVDVCIHSQVGGYDVIVSLECRDHKRRQAVGWVEEMHAKHQRLPTNVLVLASPSGFTREALRLADKYGIETVEPGAIPESFGEAVAQRLSELWFKSITPTVRGVVATVEAHGDMAEERVALDANTLLFTPDDTEGTTALQFATEVLNRADFTGVMRDATGEEKSFSMGLEPGPEGLFLRKEDPAGDTMRQITRIELEGPAVVSVVPIPLSHGQFRDSAYAYGSAETAEHEILYVVTDPVWGDEPTSRGTSLRVRRKATAGPPA